VFFRKGVADTPHRFITFSFDDGTVQDIRLTGLMKKYGLKGTFNLNSGNFGTHHRIVHEGIDCDHTEVEASQVRDIYAGFEIASHTVNHPSLLDCSDAEIIHQVGDDCKTLEALSGQKIVGMAYPGGPCYDGRVIRTIMENTPVRYARDTISHHTFAFPSDFMRWEPSAKMEDKEIFDLIERFKTSPSGKDELFYIWGHSFEFDKFGSWDRVERIFAALSGLSGAEYVTNGDVYRYVTAQK
jgi:peptidoglycan/xylan/chitin deacetylase (PgdA/CDA1 family)